MKITHHVSDALLAAYATGELAEGWSLAIATHLALCPQCRARLSRFENEAAKHFGGLDPAGFDGDAGWARLCARLAKAPPSPATAFPASSAQQPVLPEPLRSYLGADAAQLRWKPLGRGAYHLPVATRDSETRVRLLRIPAGKPVPEHSHGGRELTLVLAGSFSDATGRFMRGDIEEADETLEHQPIAGDGEDCICLAVTDAPLRFKNRLLRLIQPLLGI